MNFSAIIKKYISQHREQAREELHYYKNCRSLKGAIRDAALSRRLINGKYKKHSHQYRIPSNILKEAERNLQDIATRMRAAKSFAELHRLIERQIKTIHGVGELTIYDIAHRIGAYFDLEPKEVYLHAGTREGARALNLGGKTIAMRDLPPGLRKLSPAEIEDVLCIYKNDLRCLRQPTRSRCVSPPRRSC